MKEDRLGRLAETIFHNEQNFYTVAVFESADEQFYAVGTLPYPKTGRDYRLTGEWKTHPKYGEQFSFTSFEEMEPRGEEGILAFLASGSIKGIGPSAAEKIVKRFGEHALEVIQNEPDRLTEISGIGKVKAKAIHEGYEDCGRNKVLRWN